MRVAIQVSGPEVDQPVDELVGDILGMFEGIDDSVPNVEAAAEFFSGAANDFLESAEADLEAGREKLLKTTIELKMAEQLERLAKGVGIVGLGGLDLWIRSYRFEEGRTLHEPGVITNAHRLTPPCTCEQDIKWREEEPEEEPEDDLLSLVADGNVLPLSKAIMARVWQKKLLGAVRYIDMPPDNPDALAFRQQVTRELVEHRLQKDKEGTD